MLCFCCSYDVILTTRRGRLLVLITYEAYCVIVLCVTYTGNIRNKDRGEPRAVQHGWPTRKTIQIPYLVRQILRNSKCLQQRVGSG